MVDVHGDTLLDPFRLPHRRLRSTQPAPIAQWLERPLRER